MRAVVQRVTEAAVKVEGKEVSRIEKGLLVLLGIESSDTEEDIHWLVQKIAKMRIFEDAEGVMNISLQETKGEILLVSQFTLHASTKKGNRPSYIKAAAPEKAMPVYYKFITQMEQTLKKPIKTGIFGTMMDVTFTNHGPVTIIIDTKNKE